MPTALTISLGGSPNVRMCCSPIITVCSCRVMTTEPLLDISILRVHSEFTRAVRIRSGASRCADYPVGFRWHVQPGFLPWPRSPGLGTGISVALTSELLGWPQARHLNTLWRGLLPAVIWPQLRHRWLVTAEVSSVGRFSGCSLLAGLPTGRSL